ncbi:ABC transporter glutamine-binding protein GlnH [Austwickia sp. TVS 96-490-7B]|uniref:glutamate ABC transporter substrate-binding protein n=1 Tax=Austwickia sp. TVS 96-490-7B TaxID=2830843 RepID=UPI001C58FFE8|nr:glutamate ABC transporter substrate-binding protein [Austwickia sp. TVS 96-490-7B]MBW3085352.1 ABC transporter glutamine-binding protein GlnH [Austwickia sp. TVS 96-490-7B]
MSPRRTTVVVATAATLTLGLGACSALGSDPSDGPRLKIGIKYDQPGLGLKQGYRYTGMDVDVARSVAKRLGVEESRITWVQAPSSQRETLISTGQVDFIVGTYSITDARKKKVSFAGPYFIAGQDLLVKADSTIDGTGNLAGKKLCSVTGSTSAQQIAKKVSGVNLQNFSTYSECVAGLTAGAVDALTTDDTILAGYAAQDHYKGKVKLVGKPFTKERYGIGLKKGDTALCTKLTDAITQMIADGEWRRIVDSNLGAAGYSPGEGNPPTPDPCS